ncbi:MAG: hypothetical protein PHS19_04270 [Eubacteriales bacterium]|nr:hypothetical protein [Eubacteriales bacterium]
MSIINKRSGFVSMEEIAAHDKLDEKFFRNVRMSGDKVLAKFKDKYEMTKAKVLENVSVQYLMESYGIDSIEGDRLKLVNGVELESTMLSRVLDRSEEVVFSVITVHGYDEMEQNTEGTMDKFFVDGWGTAVISCAHEIIRAGLKQELLEDDMIATPEWHPGQHQVGIELQIPLFETLMPGEIGVELTESLMMHPKKSESGFTGIGHDKEQSQIEACDVCTRRLTCPSAHGSDED